MSVHVKVKLHIPSGTIRCEHLLNGSKFGCRFIEPTCLEGSVISWECVAFGEGLEEDENGLFWRCKACLLAEVKE